MINTQSIPLVLPHMFGCVEQKLLCRSRKSFSKIFMSVRIISFNAIHSVIKKTFHKGPVAN
jgi:hypothetical protein